MVSARRGLSLIASISVHLLQIIPLRETESITPSSNRRSLIASNCLDDLVYMSEGDEKPVSGRRGFSFIARYFRTPPAAYSFDRDGVHTTLFDYRDSRCIELSRPIYVALQK
jgi:hypothetical protein